MECIVFGTFFHHLFHTFKHTKGNKICEIIFLKFNLRNKKTLQISVTFLMIVLLVNSYCTTTPWKVMLKSSSPPVEEPN